MTFTKPHVVTYYHTHVTGTETPLAIRSIQISLKQSSIKIAREYKEHLDMLALNI